MRSVHLATVVVAGTYLLSSCGAPSESAKPADQASSASASPVEVPTPSPTPSPEDTLESLDTKYFTISFPDAQAEKEIEKHDNMAQTSYTIDLESGDRMVITVLDLDPGITFDLTQGMAGGAEAMGGKVLASRNITVDGWPAIRGRYSIKVDNSTGTGWATVIDKNQDVVLAMTYEGWSMPDRTTAPTIYERALASIKIK